MRRSNPLPFILVLAIASSLHAENWSGWRGPRGDGTSLEKNLPVEWNGESGENIAWKVVIEGKGHGSPSLWEERVFLVSCNEETKERILLCLDRDSGKTLWRKVVFKAPLETLNRRNSRASSTPACDGELVVTAFLEVDGHTIPAPNVGGARPVTPGNILVVAYDSAGNEKWRARPGEFISAHGFCSNPVLYKDLVIVNGDHDGDSYLVALERASGKTRWKVPRDNKTRSYVTPVIRTAAGREQLFLSGSLAVASYDPANGKKHWWMQGPTEQFVASTVFDGEFVFVTAGYPEYHILAIRTDGVGDVTDSHIAWRTNRGAAYVPSPVLVGPYLMVVSDKGFASCFTARTGERHWMERLEGGHNSSLVTAGGLVYCLSEDGHMTVVRPGAKFERVARNPLGERCSASPAVSAGRLYLRGEKHLFAIGKASTEG